MPAIAITAARTACSCKATAVQCANISALHRLRANSSRLLRPTQHPRTEGAGRRAVFGPAESWTTYFSVVCAGLRPSCVLGKGRYLRPTTPTCWYGSTRARPGQAEPRLVLPACRPPNEVDDRHQLRRGGRPQGDVSRPGDRSWCGLRVDYRLAVRAGSIPSTSHEQAGVGSLTQMSAEGCGGLGPGARQ